MNGINLQHNKMEYGGDGNVKGRFVRALKKENKDGGKKERGSWGWKERLLSINVIEIWTIIHVWKPTSPMVG